MIRKASSITAEEMGLTDMENKFDRTECPFYDDMFGCMDCYTMMCPQLYEQETEED